MEWVENSSLTFRGLDFSDEAVFDKALDKYNHVRVTNIIVWKCRLKRIPPWLPHKLPKVREIDFRFNLIREIPDYIVDFRNLQKLHLQHNSIERVSPKIALLAENVTELSISWWCEYGRDFERLHDYVTYANSPCVAKNYVLSLANFSLRRRNVCAAIYLVLFHFPRFMPRDVVKNILAPMLWESRYENVWRCQNEKRETRSKKQKQK